MRTNTSATSGNGKQRMVGFVKSLAKPASLFPPTMVLSPISRRPTMLPDDTVKVVLANPVPKGRAFYTGGSTQRANKRVSIVVVTFNNLVFTRLCLESVLANTDYDDYELVVVDNRSSDGTAEYLGELARNQAHVAVILNDTNRGFAPATNQGLDKATGDVLVLLNNDTMVPTGWLTGLGRHLDDSAVGLVGPVTNRIGNEAQIAAGYQNYEEFERFAKDYTQAHEGKSFDMRMLMMFCVAMRRDVYESIGPLDERFEIGMFEDDDYSMRAREAGYRVVCAEDVFVHHFGQASICKLALTGEYGKVFHANRLRFERKWGISWQPHQYRPSAEYQRLTERICGIVQSSIPADATVLVVSKGDEDLLKLEGRHACHFPQSEDGKYAGYYPTDSDAAIAHLEALRLKGCDYLLFPETGLWWLEHYGGLRQHLESRYRAIAWEENTCLIFALQSPPAASLTSASPAEYTFCQEKSDG